MPAERLRTALVGCGRIGSRTRPELAAILPSGWLPLSHADAIRSVPGLDLVALCDSSAENLKRASEAYGIAWIFADYCAMLADVRPEIVSIATRTPGRCDIALEAVRCGARGLHLEKPLSTSLADGDRVLAAVEEAGIAVSYGTTRRFMDIYREARERVRAGEIGDLLEIQLRMGRTNLLWSHPHSVDLMIFFAGTREIESVQSSCVMRDGSVSGNQIDDDPIVESALVRFSNGVRGVISSAGGSDLVLSGSRGTLRVAADGRWIDLERGATPDAAYFLETRRIDARAGTSGTAHAFRGLEASLRSGAPSPMTPQEIRLGQQIIFAIGWSSLKGGLRVPLQEVPPTFTVTGRYGAGTA